MSRMRAVKPEFWTSEQVVSCSLNARLLFIGLWNFSDDHGVHPASYVRLKAEIFPVDSFSIGEVKQWVGELVANELLREYTVENKGYWIITGWEKHQRIDKPTYRHPLPLSGLKKISDNSASIQREVIDNSATPRLVVDARSVTDRNGKDRNGKENNICEVVPTSPLGFDNKRSSLQVQKIFEYWQQTTNHPRSKLDVKRKGKIEAAIKLGYEADELKQAIDGCVKTPFNMGDNERKQRYDSIDLIFRDAEHIERFMNNAVNPPLPMGLKDNTNDLMAGVV